MLAVALVESFVDVVPQRAEPDVPAVIKKQYRDKYGRSKYRDQPTQLVFRVELAPREERMNLA